MSETLFRPEVLESERRGWLGTISLAQPPSLCLLMALAAIAAAAVVMFLICGEYARRSRVVGQLVPDLGLSTVVAPAGGIVARVEVEEGDDAQSGESLILLSVPHTAGSGTDVFAGVRAEIAARRKSVQELARSRIERLETQRLGYSRRLAAAREELTQARREIATREEQVRLGAEAVERLRIVTREGYANMLQLREREQALLELTHARQSLERQAAAIRRGIAELEQALAELPAERAALLAQAERELAELDQERMQHDVQGELLIRAPVSGLVSTRLVAPGQAVLAGQPLLTLLPQGSRLQAQLYVPSRAMGFVEPGQRVLLRYQAYPHQKFGHQSGRTLRVSRSPIDPGEPATLLGGSGRVAEPHYRVVVELDRQSVVAYGEAEPLRPGMLLEADILGERRRLYEWLLEPLYSVRGRMGS